MFGFSLFVLKTCILRTVRARFITTARFVTKVTKRAAMPARFVTNEVVTNRAGIGYQYM